MDNVMPEMNSETLRQITEQKGQEMFDTFLNAVSKGAVNDQITDAVTLSPDQLKSIAKECTLAHLTFFKSPFEQISQQKMEGLNGAAVEKLKLVTEYWKGVSNYIENI
jgi:hypothetical protein